MSQMRTQSLQFRLTILFAFVSTAVLLVLGFVISRLVESHFQEMDFELLEGKVELVSDALHKVSNPDDLKTLPAKLDAALVGHHGMTVAIWKSPTEALYQFGDGYFPEKLRDTPSKGTVRNVRWMAPDGQPYRGVATRVALGIPGATSYTLTISTELTHHEHFMHSFEAALSMVVGIAALISGLLGWGAARRGLAPLRGISRDAAAVTATNLSQRLSMESIPVELKEVVRTLNEMLERLEDSFLRLSDFSSDLAHELRTPVSNLLTQTQVTLSKARTIEEYQDVLGSNIEEFERLSKMISDMLFLAKAENELVVPSLEMVDLRKEVEGLLEFYEAVAEDAGISLQVDGSASVACDKLMVRRAIGNLVSNAIRYTPAGGKVTVRLASEGPETTIAVENNGETIPEEHLPRLFDRFYRADASRKRHSEGVGLGLAITRSIVRAHGGDAVVTSGNGMTVFTLKLPS